MKNHFDIVVAGGGFAGACAAISAARLGKRVCLIEKHNCLGGSASFGLVLPFMYYWTRDPKNGEKITLSRGLFEEIVKELKRLGGVHPQWEECFNEEILKLVLNRMAIDSGVTILFQAYMTEADAENGFVKSIKINHVGGQNAIFADYFIDATGDGSLCFMSGFEFMQGREVDGLCQPMTLSFRLSGVDINLFGKTHRQINELYRQYKAEGKITNPRENILTFKTTHRGVLHFNATRVTGLDPTNPEDLTRAEIMAREQVLELYMFLKENFEAFKNSTLLSTGMQIGVRESRRILGEHILSQEDLLALTKFEDSVACCNYDIDIHNPSGEGTSHHYFKDGEYYTIPYRSLVPKGSKNLLVCGRCVSATHEAQASLRIMPTCAALGQAAGTACAIAHTGHQNVNSIDVQELRRALILQGAKI
ncbi:MAG: FAD-dependent oxidoreductase [Ruminococcaceae bacterium]|nr:FAD-dependent oxidoreductase [Oscillospiraceae bacterium]